MWLDALTTTAWAIFVVWAAINLSLVIPLTVYSIIAYRRR